jgi:exopolysaccharide biosynthesis predicted pyruvyltransferase EpsI
MQTVTAHEPFIEALGRQIDLALKPLLAGSRRIALLDFPNHSNVGDSAIWLGELAYLRSLGEVPLAYTCDVHSYSRIELAKHIGDGLILLSGGGNLGDLWEQSQHLREQVIRDFPDNRIVQLPQSIHFQHGPNLRRARQVFNAHPALTLLLRDRRSLAVAADEFRTPAHLCPDMAFALGALARPCQPTVDFVWLSRTDKESLPHVAMPTSAMGHRVDWLAEPSDGFIRLQKCFDRRLSIHPRVLRRLAPLRSHVWERAARRRLRRGCRLLASGRTVLTDRLHGHILSVLLGVPHFVLDSSTGKVRSFYETWTHSMPFVRWCETPAEALGLARLAAAEEES